MLFLRLFLLLCLFQHCNNFLNPFSDAHITWIHDIAQNNTITLFEITDDDFALDQDWNFEQKRDIKNNIRVKRSLESQLLALPNPTTPEFISRANIGLFLRKVNRINVATSYWTQVWTITLPPFMATVLQKINCTSLSPYGAEPLKTYLGQLCKLLQTTNENLITAEQKTLNNLLLTAKILDDLTQNKDNLFYQGIESADIFKMSKRGKRGIFNFIGDIQKQLFGTATEDDVKQIGELKLKFDALSTHMQENFNKQTENLVKFAKLSDDRFIRLNSGLITLNEALNKTIHDFGVKFNEIAKDVTAMSYYMIEITSNINKELVMINQFQQFSDYVRDWIRSIDIIIESISDASSGFMNANLVKPEQILRILDLIEPQLQKQKMELVYDKSSIQAYYTQPLTSILISNEISIILKIPVAQSDTIFDLWKTYIFDVPLVSDQPIFTRLSGIPDYIASSVTPGEPKIMELSSDDIISCSGNTILECPSGLKLPSFHSANCIRKILELDSIISINKSCDFVVLNKTDTRGDSFIQHLGKTTWLVHSNDKHWTLKCPNSDNSPVKPQHSAVIALPCFCSLQVGSQIIPAGVDDKCNSFYKAEIWPTFNAWIGLKFTALDTKGLLTGIMSQSSIKFDYQKLQSMIPSSEDIQNIGKAESDSFLSFQKDIKKDQEEMNEKLNQRIKDIEAMGGFIPDGVSNWLQIAIGILALIALLLSLYTLCSMRRNYQPIGFATMLLLLTMSVVCLADSSSLPKSGIHVHHISVDTQNNKENEIRNLDEKISTPKSLLLAKEIAKDIVEIDAMKEHESSGVDLTHVDQTKLNWIFAFCILAFLLLLLIGIIAGILLYGYCKLKKPLEKGVNKSIIELKNKTGMHLYNGTGIYCELLLSINYKLSPSPSLKVVLIHITDIAISARDLTPASTIIDYIGKRKVYERGEHLIFAVNWPFDGLFALGHNMLEFPREMSISKKSFNKEISNFLKIVNDIEIVQVCRIFGRRGDEIVNYFEGQCNRDFSNRLYVDNPSAV
ncbi:putative glycoprotein [Hubei myriapoda virus 8]|uniref:Putative glycoprotein n=1 Tax=Hubei myriapoda virus 8 TaxID=1922937 RepID=A0A1L3KN57_9VIRU|nr:putative glycoprotein [Hubei myriapoda virus 8]APG78796.1 putative glycoprotein [Hubei myriapoda virus 8]